MKERECWIKTASNRILSFFVCIDNFSTHCGVTLSFRFVSCTLALGDVFMYSIHAGYYPPLGTVD